MLLESSNASARTICRLNPRMCCLTTQLLSRDKFFLNLRKLISIPRFYIISYITLRDSRLLWFSSCLPSLTFSILISSQLAGHAPYFQQLQFVTSNTPEVGRLGFPSLRNSRWCQTCQMTLAQHSDTGGVTGVFKWPLPEHYWGCCKLARVSWLFTSVPA